MHPVLRFCFILAAILASGEATAFAADPDSLVRAYPDHLSARDAGDLVWRDGTRMAISDQKSGKDFETMLDEPDIDDMFQIPYRPGPASTSPGENEDPGRIRYEPLFRKMYGDCMKGEVQKHLRSVRWMPSRRGGSIQVTTVNKVADRLEAVVADLEKLPEALTKFLVPSAGTYNCRPIAGTNRMSMHAYGASIDISVKHAHYWRWSKDGYKNSIPFEIVEVFERHGFIWGGKWFHFDTMHFEYRPEFFNPKH